MKIDVKKVIAKPDARINDEIARLWATEIDKIAKQRRVEFGAVKEEWVEEAARSARHPLHKFLEWDDSIAARRYRVEQVRSYIRQIHIVYKSTSTRLFVNLSMPRKVEEIQGKPKPRPRMYINVKEVLENEDLRKQMLLQAKRDFETLEHKYAVYKELASIFETAKSVWKTLWGEEAA